MMLSLILDLFIYTVVIGGLLLSFYTAYVFWVEPIIMAGQPPIAIGVPIISGETSLIDQETTLELYSKEKPPKKHALTTENEVIYEGSIVVIKGEKDFLSWEVININSEGNCKLAGKERRNLIRYENAKNLELI